MRTKGKSAPSPTKTIKVSTVLSFPTVLWVLKKERVVSTVKLGSYKRNKTYKAPLNSNKDSDIYRIRLFVPLQCKNIITERRRCSLRKVFLLLSNQHFSKNHIEMIRCFAHISRDPVFLSPKKYENHNIA